MYKYALASFLFLMLFSTKAIAQKICKQSVVYFDFGKHNLSESETAKLDSILQMPYYEFVIELSGHTDHISSDSFNLELANRRVQEVVNYIQNNSAKKIIFKTNSFGRSQPKVPNNSDENRALNRRVEINVIPMDEGRVVIHGKNGEIAKIELSSFDGCGICDLEPTFTESNTQEEFKSKNIDLEELIRQELCITSMMFRIDVESCDSFKNKEICGEIVVQLPENNCTCYRPCVLDSKGYVRSLTLVTSNYRDYYYVFQGCFLPMVFYIDICCNALPSSKCSIIINKFFSSYSYSYDTDKGFLSEKNDYVDSTKIDICKINDTLRVICFNTEIDYFIKLDIDSFVKLPIHIRRYPNYPYHSCSRYPPLNFFRLIDSTLLSPVTFNDTTLIIKSRIWGKPQSISLYNEEYQYNKEITRKNSRKYHNAYMEFPHKIAVKLKNGNTFLVDYDKVKKRYKKKRKKLIVKVRRRDLK